MSFVRQHPYGVDASRADERSSENKHGNGNTPDSSRSRQVNSSSSTKQKLPEKVERTRSHSMSSPASAQTAPPARKRTSSGVFQVDETEPPPKKTELTRTNAESSRKKTEAASNGRRKAPETDSGAKKEKQKIVFDKFDKAKPECVSAFKESDSWE